MSIDAHAYQRKVLAKLGIYNADGRTRSALIRCLQHFKPCLEAGAPVIVPRKSRHERWAGHAAAPRERVDFLTVCFVAARKMRQSAPLFGLAA